MFTKRNLLAAVAICGAAGLAAQSTLVADVDVSPNYFVTVLFGVMLAIGFQFLLTALSLAIGVTAIPNLKESYVESRYGKNNNNSDDTDWNETKDASNVGVQLSTAFGIWNVVTAGISLFAATMLALTLTPIVTPAIAMTLGLTIWAVFYLLMFYLEGKMAGTLIGGLINTAVAGLRAGADTVKSIFAPSPTSQVQKVADNTIEKFRSEMSAAFDTDGITAAINNFTSQVGKNVDKAAKSLDKASTKVADKIGDVPSYDQLKTDLQETLTKAQKESGSSPAKWTAIQSAIQTVIDQSGNDGEDSNDNARKGRIQQLQDLVSQFQNSNQGGSGQRQSGVQLSQTYDDYVGKLNEWLESATPEDFDTERLTTQLQNFYDDPRGTSSAVLDRVKTLDKQTVIKTITKNTSLDQEQVEKYADKVTEVLAQLQDSSSSLTDNDTVKMIQDKVTSFINGVQGQVSNVTSSNGTTGSLDFAGLKNQFMAIVNNPSETFDTVSSRIQNYRRQDLVDALVANTSLSHADINNAVGQFESAQNTVKDQLQAAADAANSAKNQAARRAVIQAEGARKAAVAASWWLFAAIVVSGVAAVLGAQVGM